MASRIIVCPGQGAQAVGMGKAWCDASSEARSVFEQADTVVGDRLGSTFTSLCFDGPAETLNRTDVAQPALYVAGVASYRGLLAEWGVSEAEANVGAAGGLSLGEITALHLAGCFSFEDGLELVLVRGRAMQDAAEAVPSGMIALIGADEDQANDVVSEAAGGDVLVAANFNAPGQIVLSGAIAAVDRAESVVTGMGLRAAKLSVAGAFHSPIMQPAADQLREALDKTDMQAPRFPVSSNPIGRAHDADVSSIRDRLVEQLTGAVRWADCVTSLAADYPDAEWHELAPGKTLAGLARRIDRSLKIQTHDAP